MRLLTSFKDVAIKTDFKSERLKMWRARKKTQIRGCRGIRSMDDFVNYLKSDLGKSSLKHEDSDIELKFEIVKVGGKSNVILRDDSLLKKMNKGEKNHADGTFGCRPNLTGCSQLLTIMVRKYDKVCIHY